MKSFAAVLSLVAVVPAALALTINTPASVVVCQPIQFSWTGGTAPFFPSVIPGGQPSAAALIQFNTTSDTSLTWKAVNIAAGTSITVALKDSTGTTAFTDKVTVQSGSDTSCVGKATDASAGTASASTPASGSSGTTGSTTGSTPSGTTGSSTTGPSAVSSSTASTKASSTTSSSPSSSTTKSSGASQLSAVTFGLVGIMGLLGASLF